MAYSEELVERIRKAFGRTHGVTEKKMFGGVCFLVNGNMSCGVAKDELMVRVGPEAYEECLSQKHVREMDFTGKPLKGMVYVNSRGIRSDQDLKYWVDCGKKFARSLPKKQ